MKRYIIPIFIPHYGCVNDCVFCNQRKITGVDTAVTPAWADAYIAERLSGVTEERHIEAAFYGGSFTALPETLQTSFLKVAYRYKKSGRIHNIRLSTRPDCISPAVLRNLRDYGVDTIEIGVQSLDDGVLQASRRGHTAQAAAKAAALIKKFGFTLGLQLMLGLPLDTWESMLYTIEKTIDLKPDFARLYPVLVLAGTGLAERYEAGDYQPLTLDKAVRYTAVMKLLLERQGIAVIRTGLQASMELNDSNAVLAGPYHAAFGELVDSYLFYLLVDDLFTRLDVNLLANNDVTIHHHKRDTSKLRGLSNGNVKQWRGERRLKRLLFKTDGATPDTIAVELAGNVYTLNKRYIGWEA